MIGREGTEWYSTLPEEALRKLDNLVNASSSESLSTILTDPSFSKFIDSYLKFREEVRKGEHGKTAQLWMSYIDHVCLIFALLEAVQDNNFFLYVHVLYLMAVLFFSYNGQNYARYLSFFSLFLANIEESHPGATKLLQLGTLSVA